MEIADLRAELFSQLYGIGIIESGPYQDENISRIADTRILLMNVLKGYQEEDEYLSRLEKAGCHYLIDNQRAKKDDRKLNERRIYTYGARNEELGIHRRIVVVRRDNDK